MPALTVEMILRAIYTRVADPISDRIAGKSAIVLQNEKLQFE